MIYNLLPIVLNEQGPIPRRCEDATKRLHDWINRECQIAAKEISVARWTTWFKISMGKK